MSHKPTQFFTTILSSSNKLPPTANNKRANFAPHLTKPTKPLQQQCCHHFGHKNDHVPHLQQRVYKHKASRVCLILLLVLVNVGRTFVRGEEVNEVPSSVVLAEWWDSLAPRQTRLWNTLCSRHRNQGRPFCWWDWEEEGLKGKCPFAWIVTDDGDSVNKFNGSCVIIWRRYHCSSVRTL